MELKNLQTFYHASYSLNYSKTAELLNFSQPAVTKQIQHLEEELGRTLFSRVGNRTYLTPAGEILQEYADNIFHTLQELENELKTLDLAVGTIKIGADISFVTNDLQPIISEFYRTNPNLQTQILTWNSREVISAIESNELDVGIISGEYKNPKVKSVMLAKEDVIMVTSKAIAERYSVKYIKRKYPLIRYNAVSPYADALGEFLKINNLEKQEHIAFNSLEAVKSAVLHGVGVSALTKDTVEKELEAGELVELAGTYKSMQIETSMIYHVDKSGWIAIRSLKRLIKTMWRADKRA